MCSKAGFVMESLTLLDRIREYWAGEEGVTSAEYAVLIGFFVLTVLAAWETFGVAFGRGLRSSVDAFDNLKVD